MAWTVEAYYEQRTNNDVLDRIEIQQDGGAGRNLELEANSQGFRYRLSEITSESDDGLINPLANKIQVGKLTFFPKIEPTAEETLLDDILGSPDNSFRIVWKQDGSVFWTGYVDNKKRSYPETGSFKFTEIRASDFELLKTIDYTLDDTRQTLITTIADLLGNLSFGYNIRTATSWITEDTTSSTDFLSQIYHETKALREFARTGDESDQPISVWDALVSVGDPALLFRQVNGEFTVEQLTAFSDPSAVSETVYTSAGVVSTATTSVDRRLTGFTSTDSGSLVVKNGSQNDIYPGIKRAKVVFDHRTQVSGIELPSDIDLVDAGTESFTQLFIGDGTQDISLSFDVYAETNVDQTTMDARFRILIDTYYLQDDGSWSTTTNSYYEVSLTKGKPLVGGGNVWRGSFSILTDDIPDAADGTMTLQFAGATGNVDFANDTLYTALSFKINNPVASENSTTIHYQLTQSDGYSTNFTLNNTWFGDGPTGYSVSALRFGSGDGQVTADSWQRRGSIAYRSFHENLLKEILDLQRTNTRKLNAEFWGQYDPSKVLVYDSQNFYCAGVSYTGVLGRWSANLFRVNVQTGTDTFEDIPKFTNETGSGTGSTSGGGGGGVGVTEGDARWFKQSNNLSEGTASTIRDNIGLGSTDDVKFNSIGIGASSVVKDFEIWGAEPTFRFRENVTTNASKDIWFNDNRTLNIGIAGTAQLSHNSSGHLNLISGNLQIGSTTAIDSSRNAFFIEGEFASNSGIVIGAETNAPRLGTQRSTATGSLTVQPTGGNAPGSVEIFPHGTSVRSHFLATNAPDTDNFGFVEFEVNSTDAWIHSEAKGTGTAPTNFRFYNFANGVKFDDSVLIGSNTTPTAVLTVDHTGNDNNAVRIGDISTPASTTGIYMRSTTSGEIRVGTGADLIFSPNNTEAGRFTSAGDLEVNNNLRVAGGLFAKEFIVDVTRNQSSVRMSPTAGGKIATITDATVGAEKVKFEDEDGNAITPFSDNDLFQIQVATGASSGTIVKSIKRKVVADGQTGNVVSLTTIGATTGTDVGVIEIGDDATHAGNTTDATRDHYIDFITAGVTIPYIGVKDEVIDFGSGFEAVRFGGVNSFDASITGDAGIMGATSAEGAVFWITEDEAKIGGFEIEGDRLFNGFGTGGYIEMNNVSSTQSRFLVTSDGDVSSGSGNYILMQYTGGDMDFQARVGGDLKARFGSIDNFLSGLNIEGDLTTIDGGRVIGRDSSSNLVFSLSPSGVTFWNSSGSQVFSANSGANEVRIANRLRLDLDTATSASSGGASALPANPETYISVDVNDGGTVKTLWIPAYDSSGSPPSAPTSVSLCQAASALRVSWGSVATATGYIVERATSATGPWSQVSDTASTSYDDPFPPFNSSVTYHYRVFAYNANGSSGASSTVSDSYDGATAC